MLRFDRAWMVCALVTGFCALAWGVGRGVGQGVEKPAETRRGVPTVYDYGAVGDGKADDTEAIRKMVEAKVGAIRFPRGRFRITEPIVIDLDRVGPASVVGDGPATIIMAGPGPALEFVGTHQGTAGPATVKDNVWNNQRTPLIDGIEIVGAHPEAIGLRLTRTMQAVISRVTIRRALHGIHLYERNRNIAISECHIYENRGVGIFLDHLNLHQIDIANCHVSYNGGGGIVARDSEVRNLQIGVCDIEGNMADDGPPTANILIDVTNGSVREGAIVGCTIQHNHTAPDSANIRFIGRSREEPIKVGHFTISHNALSDVAVNIHLTHARGVTITGNTLWKAFSHNLHAVDCSNLVIGPNLFDRNPDYRPADSPNGLLFEECSDSTLSGLHVNGTLQVPAGLILRKCRRMNVTNCTILDCENRGLLLEEADRVRVSDCLIVNDRPESEGFVAFELTGGKDNMVVDNLLVGKVDIAPDSAHVAGNVIKATPTK